MKPDALAILKSIAHDVPLFAASAVVWLAALVVEVRLLVVVRRRVNVWTAPGAPAAVDGTGGNDAARAPDRRLEWLAIAGPVVYLGIALVSTMIARARMLQAFNLQDTAARVTTIVDGFGGLLNALPFAIQAALPLVLLAAYTVAVSAWSRHRAQGRHPSRKRYLQAAFAVVALGLAPVGIALVGYCFLLIKVAAGVAGVDPEFKVMMLTRGMEEARGALGPWIVVGAGGLVATTLAIGWAWVRGAAATQSAPAGTRDRGATRLAAALFGAALALFAATVPLRAENRLPWPEPSRSSALNVGAFEDSALVGPDPVPWAPVLFVEADRMLVEGSPASPRRAYEMLTVLRNNYALLHPGEPFPGLISIHCPERVPAAALERALQMVAAAGYLRPSLIWARPGVVDRPLLGAVPRPRISAAALVIPAGSAGQRGWLEVASAGSCGAFAEQVAKWRRRGTYLALRLPPSPPPSVDGAR